MAQFKYTWTLMSRLFGLSLIRGSTFNRYVVWIVVCNLCVGLYCYLNYFLVIETGVFSELLWNYSYLQPNVDDIAAADKEFRSDFMHQTIFVGLFLTLTSALYSTFVSISHKIAEMNRQNVWEHVMETYMSNNVFYATKLGNTTLDNLHARLSTDLHMFGWNLANCLFGNIYYTGIIPTIGQAISFTHLTYATGGALCVWIAYFSFLLFLFINFYL